MSTSERSIRITKILHRVMLGFAVVLILFLLSYGFTEGGGKGKNGEEIEIVLAHWQLEVGYREALQEVIDNYNNLNHVREAGVVVRQTPIAFELYPQLINTQLALGQAPDVVQTRYHFTHFTTRSIQLFRDLDSFVSTPNPYNGKESELPWVETFASKGLGYNYSLQTYTSIPLSVSGGVRFVYNKRYLDIAKKTAIQALTEDTPSVWFKELQQKPWFEMDEGVHTWLRGDEAPSTITEFALFSEALLQAKAENPGLGLIAPFSASAAAESNPLFLEKFFQWEFEGGGKRDYININRLLRVSNLAEGRWSFLDEPYYAFMDWLQTFSVRYSSPSWVGIDRDRAFFSFLREETAVAAIAQYDYSALRHAANEIEEGGGAFNYIVSLPPIAGSSSLLNDYYKTRYEHYLNYVTMSISRGSKNSQWAIDFLRYATSREVNHFFNKATGWLPITDHGMKQLDTQQALFAPVQGYIAGMSEFLQEFAKDDYEFNELLLKWLNGFYTLEEFEGRAKSLSEGVIHKLWLREDTRRKRTYYRGDQTISKEFYEGLFSDNEVNDYKNILAQSLYRNHGNYIKAYWAKFQPEKPFPE